MEINEDEGENVDLIINKDQGMRFESHSAKGKESQESISFRIQSSAPVDDKWVETGGREGFETTRSLISNENVGQNVHIINKNKKKGKVNKREIQIYKQ